MVSALQILSIDGQMALCRCACGTEKRVRLGHLKSGAVVSCGCVGRRNSAAAKTTHGQSGTRTHNIWLGMTDRCRNDRTGRYGRRGIEVCDRWSEFSAFLEDMGPAPSPNHSIDRIDVNGHYEPGNCRWATPTEQARNTTRNTLLSHEGERLTIAEWSERTGIKPATICVRLYKLGWSVEKTLTEPVQSRRNDKPWLKLGLSRSTYYRRRNEGLS